MRSGRELHVFVCSALGVGHYTALARLANELSKQEDATVRVSFLAACRTADLENGLIKPLVPTGRLAVREISLAGVDPINMGGMLSGTEALVAGMESLVAESEEKGWPEGLVVIHDPFAVYVREFLARGKRSWGRILVFPSNVQAFLSLLDISRVAKSLDEGGMIPFGCSKWWDPKTLSSLYLGAVQPEPVFETFSVQEIFRMDLPVVVSEDLGGLSGTLLEAASKRLAEKLGVTGEMAILPVGGVGYSEGDEGGELFEEHKAWLDRQPHRSVLFVATGSLYRASPQNLLRLARAVMRLPETLKVLWICAGGSDENERPADEEGEWSRLRGRETERILFAEWTNQRKVLAHAAIRGFVSHCGWNSLVENLSLGGVPQLCVPLGSEQFFNAALVCREWEVGLMGVQLGEDMVVGFKSFAKSLGVTNETSGTNETNGNLRASADELRQVVKLPDFLEEEELFRVLFTLLFSQYEIFADRMGELKRRVNEFDRGAVLRRLVSYLETLGAKRS